MSETPEPCFVPHDPIDNGTRVSECRLCGMRLQFIDWKWVPDALGDCRGARKRSASIDLTLPDAYYGLYSHYGWPNEPDSD